MKKVAEEVYPRIYRETAVAYKIKCLCGQLVTPSRNGNLRSHNTADGRICVFSYVPLLSEEAVDVLRKFQEELNQPEPKTPRLTWTELQNTFERSHRSLQEICNNDLARCVLNHAGIITEQDENGDWTIRSGTTPTPTTKAHEEM